jgi:hypothetical protein
LGGTWETGLIMFRNGEDIFECFSDIDPVRFFKTMSFEAVSQTRNVTRVNNSRKFLRFLDKYGVLS